LFLLLYLHAHKYKSGKGEGIKSVAFCWRWLVSVNTLLWPPKFVNSGKVYRAQRKPMFVFVLEGALFRFNVKTPEFAPLFQLPPRLKARKAQLLPT